VPTHFVQKGQINHVFHDLQTSLRIDILQRQGVVWVVTQIDRPPLPFRRLLPSITQNGLFAEVQWDINYDRGSVGGAFEDVGRNP
jgi:hypothetical protein